MMRPPWTLWRYLALRYGIQLAFVGLFLLGLIYLFESMELFRRAKDHDVETATILWMTFLKLPQTGQVIMPFVFLIAGLILFWQLGRASELVVMRSSGVSAWQFLAPVMLTAFVLGLLNFVVFQPLGASFLKQFSAYETQYLGKPTRLASLNKQGLWLREADEHETLLMHAGHFSLPDAHLTAPMVLRLDKKGRLIDRIDASKGTFLENGWQLERGTIMDAAGVTAPFAARLIRLDARRDDVLFDFTRSEMLSSWSLPGHIATLAASGFPTRTLVLYYQNLLATPFLWTAMALIAVAVSLTPHRMGRATLMLVVGVAAGFFYFLFARYFEALTLTQRIPEMLAAWVPVILATLIPISSLLQTEDG